MEDVLELGRIIRPPFALQASYAMELKAQEAEAFSLCQVNVSTLFLVDIDRPPKLGNASEGQSTPSGVA